MRHKNRSPTVAFVYKVEKLRQEVGQIVQLRAKCSHYII